MFHATLLMISTCFMHTLCHIRAFSGTNLLTRCRSASCCFLLFLVSEILVRKYSRNWTKSKPRGLFSHEASRSPKERRRGATEGPHPRAARPPPWLRGPVVWGPRAASWPALSPIKSLRDENPSTENHDTENLPETPPPPIPSRGIQEIASGTLPERGIISRRTLRRHGRLRSDVWVVYPWTMGP